MAGEREVGEKQVVFIQSALVGVRIESRRGEAAGAEYLSNLTTT